MSGENYITHDSAEEIHQSENHDVTIHIYKNNGKILLEPAQLKKSTVALDLYVQHMCMLIRQSNF